MKRWAEVFSRASEDKGKPASPDERENGNGMEKLNAVWNFFDGKKAQIGGALLLAGHVLSKFPQTAVAAAIVSEIGMYLTGFGLAHKGLKAATVGK